jgi:hypothetical protein
METINLNPLLEPIAQIEIGAKKHNIEGISLENSLKFEAISNNSKAYKSDPAKMVKDMADVIKSFIPTLSDDELKLLTSHTNALVHMFNSIKRIVEDKSKITKDDDVPKANTEGNK